jgi:hypothetical protein
MCASIGSANCSVDEIKEDTMNDAVIMIYDARGSERVSEMTVKLILIVSILIVSIVSIL